MTKHQGLRLLTHVMGETLIIFGSVLIAVNFAQKGFNSTPYFLTGLNAILVGAFCQWNPD